MLDLLIEELDDYMQGVQKQVATLQSQSKAGKSVDLDKLGDHVFCHFFSHEQQLKDRMEFIKEWAKSGSFKISHANIARVWLSVIEQNAITGDHKIVSSWLQTICDDFLLGRNAGSIDYADLQRFFQTTICSEGNSYAHLTLKGYHCIQGFFLLVNLKADKLVVQDDDVAKAHSNKGDAISRPSYGNLQYKVIDPELIQCCAKVAPNEMEGIQVLWKIAMDCQSKLVGEAVTSMLLQVHTQVDFGLEDKITQFEDQFVESCLSIIQKQRQAIESRSPEEKARLNDAFGSIYNGYPTPTKLKKVMPVEESRITACLSYLKMLVLNSERDGTNGLIPHAALNQGTLLDKIQVSNTYSEMWNHGFRNRFSVCLYSNATVYQLKQQICQQLAWKSQADFQMVQVPVPHAWTLRIVRMLDAASVPLKDTDNGKTLAELNFKNNEVVSVYKKGTQSVSKMPLLNAENELNERAKYLFTQIFNRYCIDDPEDPMTKIMTREELTNFVRGATGQIEVDGGVQTIMEGNTSGNGKMTLEEFLVFYRDSCKQKLDLVRRNLAFMGFRDDLQLMPPAGSPENILQARKTFQEMPRFKMAQNQSSFSQIVDLYDLQKEVSKEAQSVVKMICTNQRVFWDILKLDERSEDEGPFSWDMIFHEDIKMTMYSFDIIDSIIRSPITQVQSRESQLRLNWVQRFLNKGGFDQLLIQLKRAQELSRPSKDTPTLDYLSETSNFNKKFIDHVLKTLKFFIFAALYADQAPDSADNFLILKRKTSTVYEEQESKNQDTDKSNPAQEDVSCNNSEDEQSKVKTPNGADLSPQAFYDGPYASVGASIGTVVQGPKLPPHMAAKAGDSDQANIDEDDQVAIEKSLKESEDAKAPQTTQITTSATVQQKDKKLDGASGSVDGEEDFEQSARFKEIVGQIRASQRTEALIKAIDFQGLQQQLLSILATYLSNTSDSSKEEGNIISSALSLWSASVVQRNELFDSFYSWTQNDDIPSKDDIRVWIKNGRELLLHGIYSPKSLYVRNQFKECIELIAEKVHGNAGQRPLFYLIEVLKCHFPGVENDQFGPFDTKRSAEFFSLFGALIQQYQELLEEKPDSVKQVSFSIVDLLGDSFERMKDHVSQEKDSDSSPDSTLQGLLVMVKELLDCYAKNVEYDEFIAFVDKHQLMHEFFYENLYYMPELTTSVHQNKCKVQKTRVYAYQLLYKLIKAYKPKEMAAFLTNQLWPMIGGLSSPSAWRHQPSSKERTASDKYGGINNLGNICYMISMLQQFFMVPQFRYQLFRAIDSSPEDIKVYKERKVDDSLLRQFQRLFGFLELSERGAADPFDFCFAYKDLTGEPTNVGVQCDSQEFLNFFFDRMEDVLKPTSQKYLLQDVFRGTHVQQMVCQSCGKTKNNLTTEYTLSLQVENTKDLYESLNKYVQGDTIDEYKCDGCLQKVQLKKRQLLGAMPNVLIVHLQRIVFDYNTFRNKKVNSKFEFPKILDLSKFAYKAFVQGNQQDVQMQGESESETEQFAKLVEAEDDDYVYRLVGVNIHRGVADSGHYWSMINTKRGDEEPDPRTHTAEWLASNEDNWKKFDDSQVDYYNLANLETDSFGGDSGAYSAYEQDIASASGGNWGKSAYMLIYEKKLKSSLRQVVLPAEGQPAAEEEKVVEVSYERVEPYTPTWLREMIQKDNVEFVVDRQVFSTQFFYLIKLAMKHIADDLTCKQLAFPLEYLPNFGKMNQAAIKVGTKVMLDFLTHYHENACMQHIQDYMSTIFTFSDSSVNFIKKADEPSLIQSWIQGTLLDDQCVYFFHIMFNCPDKTARRYCGKLISTVINKGFRIWALVCESSEDAKDHPKVQLLYQNLKDFVTRALAVIHTRDCQKNWTRLEEFYTMLEEILTAGKPQTELVLQREDGSALIVELCDLILQKKSPKAKLDAEPRIEMGGSAQNPYFSPLVSLLSHIVRCMVTKDTEQLGPQDMVTMKTFRDSIYPEKGEQRVSEVVVISDEAVSLLMSNDFISTVMGGDYEIDAFSVAVSHLSHGNKKMTKEICRVALQVIATAESSRVIKYVKLILNQLQLNDKCSKTGQPLLPKRLEWIFGFPFLSTTLCQATLQKIGLDALDRNIKGEVYNYRSMLDTNSNLSLLQLFYTNHSRVDDHTVTALVEFLVEAITLSPETMEYFSKLPGPSYVYARYTDWIQPFLMSQLNKLSASGAYATSSKEDIVKVMSKFETFEAFLKEKDDAYEAQLKADGVIIDKPPTSEEVKDSALKAPQTHRSSPPAFVICQCTESGNFDMVENEGVFVSINSFKGDYVYSRPTGFTNLAVSAAYLQGFQPKLTLDLVNPDSHPQGGAQAQGQGQTAQSHVSENKSARAMLEEHARQNELQVNGHTPLRVKNQKSYEGATGEPQSQGSTEPPKVIADGNEEWSAVQNADDAEAGYNRDIEDVPELVSGIATHQASTAAAAASAKESEGPSAPQDSSAVHNLDQEGAEVERETFETWTGDQMHSCDDLVYKLSVSNTTEQSITYKVTFEASPDMKVNLSWPLNGIKGTLGAGLDTTVALLHKVLPAEASEAGGELQKLRVRLSQKPVMMAVVEPASNDQNGGNAQQPQGDTGAGLGTSEMGYGGAGYNNEDAFMIESALGAGADEKNCSVCTFLNPISASYCSCCSTPFK